MTFQLWHAAVVETALVAGLVVAELSGRTRARAALKLLASCTFVAAGVLLLPLHGAVGALLLLGLSLSSLGDALLIAKRNQGLFLLGLAAFLAAHLAYCAAFWARGVSAGVTLAAAAVLLIAAAALARWLFAHLKGSMRLPVAGYVLAISAMVALAAGALGEGAPVALLVGALLFYLSDLCVARERFVTRSPSNAAIGLPLYYAAQLVLIAAISDAPL